MARRLDMQINRNNRSHKVSESFIKLHGVPEKMKSNRGSAFIAKEYKVLCRSRNIDIKFSPARLQTGTGAFERAIQTLKTLIIANLENKIGLTENISCAL